MTVQTPVANVAPVAKRDRAETVDEAKFIQVVAEVAKRGGTAEEAAKQLGMKKASVVQRANKLREELKVRFPNANELPRFADARGRKANHVDADTLAALLGTKDEAETAPASETDAK